MGNCRRKRSVLTKVKNTPSEEVFVLEPGAKVRSSKIDASDTGKHETGKGTFSYSNLADHFQRIKDLSNHHACAEQLAAISWRYLAGVRRLSELACHK
jgi:hypothetical protein